MNKNIRQRPSMIGWSACAALLTAIIGFASTTPAQTQSPAAQQPDPALRDYLSANGLLNRSMYELAADEYRKFLTAHPNHEKAPVARYGLGVALYRQKKYEEAARELQPLLDRPSNDFQFSAETLLIVGQSNFELKKWDEAVAPLQKLVSDHAQHDASDDAAALLVESLYRLNRYDDLEQPWALFASNWAESPQRERVDYLRGLALVAEKDDAAAAKHFTDMQKRFPQGQFADRVTLLRAQCLHRAGDLQPAADGYRAVIAQSKGAGDLAADAVFGLAMLSQQSTDVKVASEQYDLFLEKWPDHSSAPIAMLERGRLLVDEKRYDRARTLLQQASEKDESRRDRAAYWLAKCDLREEKFAEAAKRLNDAIGAYPKSELLAEMMYDRGVALAKADDDANAIAALDEFRRRHPDHALAADATHLQAVLEHERQRYDASAELCAVFQKEYADHARAGDIAFLFAENELLRSRLAESVEKYQAFLKDHAKHPQAQTARFRMGGALFRLDRYDEAKADLEQVAQAKNTEKTYRRALLMLGDIAFQQQRWGDAQSLLTDYLSFSNEQPPLPLADDAQLKLALALIRQDKNDEALQRLADLPKNFPDSQHKLQATFERGQILLAQDRLDDARPLFQEVVDAGDSRFKVHAINHLATIAMRQEQWDLASELYAQVAAAKGESVEGAGDLGADAMFHRGQAQMAAKKYADAAATFAAMVKDNPKHTRAADAGAQGAIALSRSGDAAGALQAIELIERGAMKDLVEDLQAALLYEKAWCLRELARDDDAMVAYRALLSQHAGDVNAPHAMLELAEMETAAGHQDKAAELLASLREVSSDKQRNVAADVRERGLYRLAVNDFQLEKNEDAAKHAEAFIHDFPESELIPSAHLFAGEAQFKLERWQPAADHFAVIVEKFSKDDGCATATLRLGECQAQLNRWPDSEQTFANYLERYSDSELWFQAQFGLGWARENRGLHDQAMEAYRKVIDKHSGPTAARAQFQIGECLFAQKKHTEAVRELLKVDILYGYPEWSAAALYEAGRCFEQMGQTDQAHAQFAQVKEKYPDTEWAKLATQRLAANGASTGGGRR